MAAWSKAFTVSHHSLVLILARVCDKDASDLGKGGGSRRVLHFPAPIKTCKPQFSLNIASKNVSQEKFWIPFTNK